MEIPLIQEVHVFHWTSKLGLVQIGGPWQIFDDVCNEEFCI